MAETNITENIKWVTDHFAEAKDWEAKYAKLIVLGKALPEMDPSLKTDLALVKGCQSRVWLHAYIDESGSMRILGDSDAILVKGIVALLIRVYSGVSPDVILKTPPQFIEDIGFRAHLSPSRSNGLFSMVKQIQSFAQAFILIRRAGKH